MNMKHKKLLVLTFSSIFTIFLFSLIYHFLQIFSYGNLNSTQHEYPKMIIYSVAAFLNSTFLNLTPSGLFGIITLIENLTGLIFLGILIAILVSQKQEEIIEKLHLSHFSEKFTNLSRQLHQSRCVLGDFVKMIDQNEVYSDLKSDVKENLYSEDNYLKDVGKSIAAIFHYLNSEVPDIKSKKIHNHIVKTKKMFLSVIDDYFNDIIKLKKNKIAITNHKLKRGIVFTSYYSKDLLNLFLKKKIINQNIYDKYTKKVNELNRGKK